MDRKSNCAINYSLEHIGDPWSLLIVRDIVYFGKRTYGEFLASDERIGTSVLARKLADLEKKGVLRREPHPTDKRKEEYWLTKKGLGLIPVLLELTAWGADHDPDTDADQAWVAATMTDRTRILNNIREAVQAGNSVVGPYQ